MSMTIAKPQVAFREEPETMKLVAAAALREEIPVADFVRKLFRFAWHHYQEVGSLHALRQAAAALLDRQTGINRKTMEDRKDDVPAVKSGRSKKTA